MEDRTDRKLRVGLVGCGNFANAALIPAMRLAPIALTAVCDRDRERAQAASSATGAALFDDLATMLDAGALDAVVMAVGPHVYPKLTAQALAAGVHVMVEKPPAMTVEEAREMKLAATASRRQLGVGFMKRFATGYRMAKELTSAPEFGAITHVSARISTGVWTPAWSERLTPLALLLDHSIHFLDLIRFLGGAVRWICAASSQAGDRRFGFAAVMTFASGASGTLEISNFESRGVPNERVQIMGANGRSVTVENVTRVIYGRDAEPMTRGRKLGIDTDRVMWEPNMTNIAPENSSLVHMGYAGEMANLAESLLAGKPLSPDIDDGIAALELGAAVLASQGDRIELSAGDGHH